MTSITVRAKDPDADITYAVDWSQALAELSSPEAMLRGVYYESGDIRKAEVDTGLDYRCITAGRTGDRRPPTGFPAAAGLTVQDGSVIWTAQAPAPPIEIASVAWSVPDGLTKISESNGPALAYITLGGGVDGEDYDVTCRMTPASGAPREQTIQVPVRSQ